MLMNQNYWSMCVMSAHESKLLEHVCLLAQ